MVTNGKTAWNKDVEVGPRDAFTRHQFLKIVRKQLSESSFRDAAIFMIGTDTLTSVKSLCKLKKTDVFERGGNVRSVVTIDGRKAILSSATQSLLSANFSHLKHGDFLFTAQRADTRCEHITERQISRIVKSWCSKVGIDPTNYGTESLRRTGAIHFYERTHDINAVRILLNHTRITSTSAYLGLEDDVNITKVLAKRAAHEMISSEDVKL